MPFSVPHSRPRGYPPQPAIERPMADYLTQYYLRIPLVTSNQVAFWIKTKELLADYDREQDERRLRSLRRSIKLRYGEDTLELLRLDGFSGVYISVTDGEPQTLTLSNEDDDGRPYLAACLIQSFLAACKIAEPVSFTYAHTCSAPRIDAYGGGWVTITADGVEDHDAEHQRHDELVKRFGESVKLANITI